MDKGPRNPFSAASPSCAQSGNRLIDSRRKSLESKLLLKNPLVSFHPAFRQHPPGFIDGDHERHRFDRRWPEPAALVKGAGVIRDRMDEQRPYPIVSAAPMTRRIASRRSA